MMLGRDQLMVMGNFVEQLPSSMSAYPDFETVAGLRLFSVSFRLHGLTLILRLLRAVFCSISIA